MSRIDKIYNKLQSMNNSDTVLEGGAFDLLSGGMLVGGARCKVGMHRNKKTGRCMARKVPLGACKNGKKRKAGKRCLPSGTSAWHKFLKRNKGKGYTIKEMASVYRFDPKTILK
jgi:hypothetical protein